MMKDIKKYLVLLLSILLHLGMIPACVIAASTPTVSYQTHV